MSNSTIKEMAKNSKPMVTGEEAMSELASTQKDPNLGPAPEVKRVEVLDEDKQQELEDYLIREKGLSKVDSHFLVKNLNNKDCYHFEKTLGLKSAVSIHESMKKLGLNGSVCEFFDKLLIVLFLGDSIDLKTPKAFTCLEIAKYVEDCAEIGLNPLKKAYVKPMFKIETLQIVPIVLLAGFEKLIFSNGQNVKVSYKESDNFVAVNMPIDPDQDLNSFDFSSMYWDSNKTEMTSWIKCTIHFEKDGNINEVEGYADAKSDICLTPYWAKSPMQMLRHVAFKRAAKLIINNPIVMPEDVEMIKSLSTTRQQLKKENVAQMQNIIEYSSCKKLKAIKNKLLSSNGLYDEKDIKKLTNLIEEKIAKSKAQEQKVVKVEKEAPKEMNTLSFVQKTNDDKPVVKVVGSERDRILRQIC